MNIVIFGAAGQAGGRIAKEPVRRGHRVIAVVRRSQQLNEVPTGGVTDENRGKVLTTIKKHVQAIEILRQQVA